MDKPDGVALCVTCIVDQLMPEVGVATVKLLRRAGFEVEFPAEQTCCGQPFFNSGFRRQAASLAKRTIEIFEPYEAVVLPSGSCTGMIRAEYVHLFDDSPEWLKKAQKMAAKTFELSEFLVQQAGWDPREARSSAEGKSAQQAPKSITYHDSCHMNRILGLKEEPRKLLDAAGYLLCEMEESERCCGFGGLFSLRMPEVSTAMTAEKLRQAAQTEADIVVTADPGCLMQMRQLAGGTGQAGEAGAAGPDGATGPKIEHLATILEERTR